MSLDNQTHTAQALQEIYEPGPLPKQSTAAKLREALAENNELKSDIQVLQRMIKEMEADHEFNERKAHEDWKVCRNEKKRLAKEDALMIEQLAEIEVEKARVQEMMKEAQNAEKEAKCLLQKVVAMTDTGFGGGDSGGAKTVAKIVKDLYDAMLNVKVGLDGAESSKQQQWQGQCQVEVGQQTEPEMDMSQSSTSTGMATREQIKVEALSLWAEKLEKEQKQLDDDRTTIFAVAKKLETRRDQLRNEEFALLTREKELRRGLDQLRQEQADLAAGQDAAATKQTTRDRIANLLSSAEELSATLNQRDVDLAKKEVDLARKEKDLEKKSADIQEKLRLMYL